MAYGLKASSRDPLSILREVFFEMICDFQI